MCLQKTDQQNISIGYLSLLERDKTRSFCSTKHSGWDGQIRPYYEPGSYLTHLLQCSNNQVWKVREVRKTTISHTQSTIRQQVPLIGENPFRTVTTWCIVHKMHAVTTQAMYVCYEVPNSISSDWFLRPSEQNFKRCNPSHRNEIRRVLWKNF